MIEPKQLIAPIQEICSTVSGPCDNGVFSDVNFAVNGDINPEHLNIQIFEINFSFATKMLSKIISLDN